MNLYKKAVPKVPLLLSNGISVRFENIDHEVGIFGTEDEGLIREIEGCIARHTGGVEKITAEEYEALKTKKKIALKPRWREEFSPGQHARDRILSQSKQVADLAATENLPTGPKPPEGEAMNFRPTATK